MLALARGCLVLHTSYVRKSLEEGSFVGYDEFEFGNPKFSAGSFPNDSVTKAPYKWRHWIKVEFTERFSRGAFTGKTFIIVANNRMDQFVSIIKGGGGMVAEINVKGMIKASVVKRMKVDLCLHEPNALSKENFEILKQCGVIIHKINYLNEFFMQSTVPE
jgi:hypothetical protein